MFKCIFWYFNPTLWYYNKRTWVQSTKERIRICLVATNDIMSKMSSDFWTYQCGLGSLHVFGELNLLQQKISSRCIISIIISIHKSDKNIVGLHSMSIRYKYTVYFINVITKHKWTKTTKIKKLLLFHCIWLIIIIRWTLLSVLYIQWGCNKI